MASNAWTSNQAGLLVLDALMQDPSFCVVMARLQSKLNTLTALSSLQDVFRCIEESSRQAIAKQMAEVMLQNDEYFTALCRGIAKHIPPCRCQAKVSSPSAPTAASSSTATYVRRFLRQLMSLFSMNGAARSLETAEGIEVVSFVARIWHPINDELRTFRQRLCWKGAIQRQLLRIRQRKTIMDELWKTPQTRSRSVKV